MSPGPFALTVVAVLGGSGLVGWVATFLATREEGFYRGYHWRVHLGAFGRVWKAQILPPGGGWQDVGTVPVAQGRQVAVDLALDTIETR